jgi:transcriptional regulator with XRE-family HTH domain
MVSALANFIRSRMRFLGKNQVDIAAGAGIKESTLSNILNPKKKSGSTIPRPATIRGLAKALQTEGALLTSLLGYPVGPVGDDDRYEEIARRLPGVPWLADRLPDLMELSEDEFRDLMEWLDFRRQNANRSKSSGRGKG